jgi:hypothetical protein
MAKSPKKKEAPPPPEAMGDGNAQKLLAEDSNKRFQQITGTDPEKKGLGKFFSFGDSTKTILKSVEKSMFLQTEFLESINTNIKESNLFDRETAEDTARAENLKKVSEDEEKKGSGDRKSFLGELKDGFKDLGDDLKDLKGKARDATLGAEDDGIFKRIAKVGATATAGFFAAKGFFKTLAKKATDKLGFGEEKSEAISNSAGSAGGAGTAAAIAAKGLSFGKIGGLQAFATAAVSKLTYDALGNLDIDDDGKILGVKKEIVQGTGAALAGTATFIKSGKAFGKLGGVMKDKFNIAKKQLGAKGPDIKAPKGAKPTTKLPKPPKLDAPKTPKVSKLPTPTAKIPGAATITTSGKAGMGKPTTVKGVLNRLPAEKAAKYAKWFRIGGPLAAVIPSLIEPALAIYRDEPDEVVRKETAGALGSIGGAALGTLAGGSLGTLLFPGLGSLIGGGLGGLFGAIGGEWLLEKMVGAMLDGDDLKEGDLKSEAKKRTRGPKAQAAPTEKPSEKVSAKIADVGDIDTGPTDEQRVADAQVNADATGKALADFESTAKSRRTVTEMDDFGFETTNTVFDDAKEQEQFNKLNRANIRAEDDLFYATNKMITGDEFENAGLFEKISFLNEKGLLPEGASSIKMGKFVDGPLKGMTPDEAIAMYVAQNSSISKAAAEFKAGDKPIAKIEPDTTKPRTADGKIPAKVTPAATGDDMGLSVEEAEKQLADAKAAFAKAEQDGTIYQGFRQDELQADIAFAEKDLRDANARAAANGEFVKRKPEATKDITQVAGIESAPESLMAKSRAISEDKATQDSQAKGVMMQNLTSKGGDTITNANRGGDTTNITVLRGGSSSSLANSHLPVSQSL